MTTAAPAGPVPIARQDLLASLARHNQTFTALLALIPAHLYARPTDQEAEERWRGAVSKQGKAVGRAAGGAVSGSAGGGAAGESGKAMSKEGRKREEERRRAEQDRKDSRKRGRLARLDPSNLPPVDLFSSSTVPVAQAPAGPSASKAPTFTVPASESASASAPSSKGKRKTAPDSSDPTAAAMPPAIPPSSSALLPRTSGSATTSTSPSAPTAPAPGSNSASISDLRARLHHRIQSLQRSRGLEVTHSSSFHEPGSDHDRAGGPGGPDEPGSRDALERERREKRAELRENRRAKRRAGREEERAAERQLAKDKARAERLGAGQGSAGGPAPALGSGGRPLGGGAAVETDGLTYQAFSLPSGGGAGAMGGTSKFKHIPNPAQALEHLQARQERVAGMSDERRAELQERERWAKAEERAGGVKVADEERTLKKAVKRLEKRKAKSGKEWNDRKKVLALSQQAAIKKRNDNIAARAEARKNKKKGVKGKGDKGAKGKKRPGFEGGRPKKAPGGKGGAGGGGGEKGKGGRK